MQKMRTKVYDAHLGSVRVITLRWNTQDPLAEKYYRYSPYSYCININDPVNFVDPNGMDAIYITFSKCKANGIPFTGHAEVLLIDNKTGLTKYYEYGRYYIIM